jgi:hypothetical protein
MTQFLERFNRSQTSQSLDWAIRILAIWFFFSPWLLQFGSQAPTNEPAAVNAAIDTVSKAAWNAWVLSVIILILSFSAIGRRESWQEWVNLWLGAWIFLAPWALGFSTNVYAAVVWDHWIVGALIFIVAALEIAQSWLQLAPQRTAVEARHHH